jgi:hypothetical protein
MRHSAKESSATDRGEHLYGPFLRSAPIFVNTGADRRNDLKSSIARKSFTGATPETIRKIVQTSENPAFSLSSRVPSTGLSHPSHRLHIAGDNTRKLSPLCARCCLQQGNGSAPNDPTLAEAPQIPLSVASQVIFVRADLFQFFMIFFCISLRCVLLSVSSSAFLIPPNLRN